MTGCYQSHPDGVFKASRLRLLLKIATDDNRTTIYGALLELVGKAKETPPTTCWRFGSYPAGERWTRKRKHWKRAMSKLDVEAIRAEVRALDYVRGTPVEQQEWRDADADARHNNVIEGLVFSPVEDALFDMLRDEAVPPDLATQIILRLHDHPDADRSLAITPVGPSS